MSYTRNPEYQFVSTDSGPLLADLFAGFEKITGRTAPPGSDDWLLIHWFASVLVQERAQTNYAANQNIPSRADEKNLDELGQLFYFFERPPAKAATSVQRFHVEAPQGAQALIPIGTRVADASGSLQWATQADAFVPIGASFADIAIECLTAGTAGNGFAPGQINTLSGSGAPHFIRATENLKETGGGDDVPDDDKYFSLMRESVGAFSTAGSRNAYIFHAKKVSSLIADVGLSRPEPGHVAIFALMNDGSGAGDEIKAKILEACNADQVRPMTDYVTVGDPETVQYEIDFTYYMPSVSTFSSSEATDVVARAVESYVKWQSGALGRDINPDELRKLVMNTGAVKRIDLNFPTFFVLRGGGPASDTAALKLPPQVAVLSRTNVINGGFEDE